MKKITLFFIALFSIVILTPTNGFGQGTVQIGSGTGTVSGGAGIPVSNYVFNYNQQLVTADEYSAGGGVAGDITKIRYYPTNVGTITVWNTWTVYIGNTTKTNFSSTTDWIPLTELTEVFNGTITPDPVSNEWFEITFSTPFDYTGGNIVVAVHEYAPGWSVAPAFRGYTSTANAGIYYRSDSTNPNPSAPPTATGRVANLPQLQFEGTLASCLPPANLTSTNLTSTGADLTWTPGSGESTWNLEWKAGANFTPGSAEEDAADSAFGTPEYNASGLTPNTTYYVYLRADCGAGDTSGWVGPLTFTTLCASFIPDYIEDFATFLPDCWEEADSGDPSTGPTDIGTGAWQADGWLNSGTTGAAKVNIYWNSKSDWLLTPEFDLTGGGYEINLDVAFTVWNGTTPGTFDLEDEVQLLYTEDGTTWVNLETWNAANVPSNTGDNVTIDISSLTGSNVQFALWAKEDPAGLTSTDNDFFIDNFIVRTPLACTSAVVDSSTINEDCANNQFFVDVDITTVGDATQINDGTTTYSISGTGVLQVGPFTDGSSVTLTVEHSDAACNFSLGVFTFNCPPSNDDCENATPLTAGLNFTENPIVGTNIGATASQVANPSIPAPGCASYSGGDVWYSVVVPSDGNITIETNANPTGSGGDSGMALYSGDCNNLVLIECDDDDSPDGLYSLVSVSNPALAGQTIYARVWEFGNNADFDFQISAYSATLNVSTFDNASNFTLYPNPVLNTLTLTAQNNIEHVTVFNMLGQAVLKLAPNNTTSEVDMNNLVSGTYFAQVTINGIVKTVKVVKQ